MVCDFELSYLNIIVIRRIHQTGVLMDYVPSVTDILNERVNLVILYSI